MSLITTGCRVNQSDASRIRARMDGLPVTFVAPGAAADVVVVNACTLTRDADRSARAAVRRGLRAGARTILAGCLATRLDGAEAAALAADGCVVVPGTADREALVDALRRAVADAAGDAGHARAARPDGATPAPRDRILAERARPVVKVQDGCDGTCAFCVVPSVRGPAASVPLADVQAAVARAAARGAAEVVLAGIDLASWGRDRGEGDVAALLAALVAMGTGMRFRLSSIEPRGLDRRLLDRVGTCPDVCPHLHVAVQSGSDRVLAAMRRPDDAGELARRLADARARIPGLALGLDVICGFPGEDEDDFARTVALVQAAGADALNVFPFSPRPGTAAARMRDDVPPAVKARRVAHLRALSDRARRMRAASWIGRSVEVVDVGRPRDGRVASVAADGTPVVRDDSRGPRRGRFLLHVHAADGPTAVAATPEHA